jgi:glycosyltransferase involved in cell wall biosynthesis
MNNNVLMFCPQFRPLVGGAERQAEKLAAALVRNGCRVTILTPRIDTESPDTEEVEGVSIVRFPFDDLSRRYPISGVAILNIPYILWQVVRAVRPRLNGVDVLHCHIASLQTAGAAMAGSLTGVPVLLKAAMADRRSDLGEIEKTGAIGRLVAWLVRKSISTWVATTVAVEEALIRAGVEPTRIIRIPNGVDLQDEYLKEVPVDGVRRFLYLGRLSSNTQRDIPTVIKAFDRLAVANPKLELAIVGGGDMLEETRRLAQRCASKERIYLPGFDIPEKWLRWADCFVLPSRREGLSNALLEAMAAGLPCIANDIPPNREVLANGDAGILVPIEEIDALERAMRAFVISGELAESYSKKAKERVSRLYSIDAVAKQYQQLYRKISSKHRAA